MLGNYFELKLKGGNKVALLITMGALELFCDAHGCDLTFFDSFYAKDKEVDVREQNKVFRRLVAAGATYAAQSKGEATTFSEIDADIIMTQAGGYYGTQVQNVINEFLKTVYPDAEFAKELGEDQGVTQEAQPQEKNPPLPSKA